MKQPDPRTFLFDSSALKGRQRKAWGVSPRKASRICLKPRRGDSSRPRSSLLPPLRGFQGWSWLHNLGLTRPGFMLSPLRGLSRSRIDGILDYLANLDPCLVAVGLSLCAQWLVRW